jgi:hypothetical protein
MQIFNKSSLLKGDQNDVPDVNFVNTLEQQRLQDDKIDLQVQDFDIVKVDQSKESDLIHYYSILQSHASTLVNKAMLNGKTIADRLLQIEKNNLNGLTLKEYQAKYNITNQNRFKELHSQKFITLDKAKQQFYKKNLNKDIMLVDSSQVITLKQLLQHVLKNNTLQQNIGMFFLKDKKAIYTSKHNNVKNRIVGAFGMVVQEVNDSNQVSKVEFVNHLKEEYTGLGIANQIISKLATQHLVPAVTNQEFSQDARYVIETRENNNASLSAQQRSVVGVTWFDKLMGVTVTTKDIAGSRIVKQKGSIDSLVTKIKIKQKYDAVKKFVTCQSR